MNDEKDKGEETDILSIKQVCLDCILLICVGLPIHLIKKFGVIFKRGFFCNDDDLRHPIGKNFIDNRLFHAGAVLINIVTIIVTEFLRGRKTGINQPLWKCKIPIWCARAYHVLLIFAFGLLSAIFTATATKSIAGRLRPHFLTACAPSINCTLPQNQHVYHVHFNCTKNLDHPGLLNNARLSFPSGHANFAMYCSLFFVVYIEKRMTWRGSRLLKCMMQLLVILGALAIGVSRVSGYFHHWTDVVGGFVVGGTYAVCASLKMLKSETFTGIISTHL